MAKVDIVFFLLGIFCYFSMMYQLKTQQTRLDEYKELQKKKEVYANRLIEQKRREALAKATEERKQKNKVDMKSMTNTMEKLSALSDQEVMRKSRVTSGR